MLGLTVPLRARLQRGLLTFRRWRDELPHAGVFFRQFLLLLIFLLVENMAIWAVSATDLRRDEHTPALQDNVLLLYGRLKEQVPSVDWDWFFKDEWIAILHKLIALIALGFSAIFDQVQRDRRILSPTVIVTLSRRLS